VTDLGGTASTRVVHEEVIIRFRPHAGNLLWSALGFIVLTSVLAYVVGLFTESWINITAIVVYLVLVFIAVLVPWIAWLASRVVLTSQRVIVSHGLFHRVRREILYVRVTDVTLRRSPMQMALGTGDLLLGVGTEQPVRIHAVPRPNLVVAAVSELVFQANPRSS